jgi:transposase-like protein
MSKIELAKEYAEKIRPLLPLATKAYGPKNQKTAAHEASRKYTDLLVEYTNKGGSLLYLAQELDVAYSGVRRRVFTSNIPAMTNNNARKKNDPAKIEAAVTRVKNARLKGTQKYHAQLAHEYYKNNISLSAIAKGLGIKNAAPLYYGVQRHITREGLEVAAPPVETKARSKKK